MMSTELFKAPVTVFSLATMWLLIGCASAPPIIPPGPPTAVTFAAPRDDRAYTVRVTPYGSPPFAECVAPCQMVIPSGTTEVTVSSEGSRFVARALVPMQPSVATIHRRRNGVAVAGGVINALAGALALVSAPVYTGSTGGGIGLDVAALILFIPGIALSSSAGTDRVDFRSGGEFAEQPSSGGAAFAGAGVTPIQGGAIVGSTIRF